MLKDAFCEILLLNSIFIYLFNVFLFIIINGLKGRLLWGLWLVICGGL